MTVNVPDGESAFRLRPCKQCGCKGVGYQFRQEGKAIVHRVMCPGCKARSSWQDTRHEAQREWNLGEA